MTVNNDWLVVSTLPSEKYDFVSWDDDSPNIPNIWNLKAMFQTTSQGMNIERA